VIELRAGNRAQLLIELVRVAPVAIAMPLRRSVPLASLVASRVCPSRVIWVVVMVEMLRLLYVPPSLIQRGVLSLIHDADGSADILYLRETL
jgi:hypothetical protein